MSLEANISAANKWHIGEDKRLRFTVYADLARAACADASGYGLSWKLARTEHSAALVTKTSGSGISVSGIFNASPALNTQVVQIAVDDVDTQPDSGTALSPGTYYHELKRTDAGFEGVVAFGSVELLPALHTQ